MLITVKSEERTILKIFNPSPKDSVKELQECIQDKVIIPSEFNHALLFDNGYREKNKPAQDDNNSYTLTFYSKDHKTYIKISGVTYFGNNHKYTFEGNRYAITCLELMGFKVYKYIERHILSRGYLNESFTKNNY